MSTIIKLTRVDQRLLHATVALNWNQFVEVDYVAVVDSDFGSDPFIANVMQLCLPKTMKVKIFSAEDFIQFIQEDEDPYIQRRVMVIFKDLAITRKAVELGFKTNEIQLPYPASRLVIKNLNDYFKASEIEDIRVIQKAGIKLFFQTAPLDLKEYNVFTKL